MKYKSKSITIDGHKFPSKLEGERYLILKKLEKENKISNLELQPKFLLQEGFKRDGNTYRPITYIADFMYIEDGKMIVEDTKGVETDIFKLKKKLLLYKYKDFEFRVVKKLNKKGK